MCFLFPQGHKMTNYSFKIVSRDGHGALVIIVIIIIINDCCEGRGGFTHGRHYSFPENQPRKPQRVSSGSCDKLH